MIMMMNPASDNDEQERYDKWWSQITVHKGVILIIRVQQSTSMLSYMSNKGIIKQQCMCKL